jgi:HD-GYP domain-containing protein (c-di-GMP phosphodiesterase class II)
LISIPLGASAAETEGAADIYPEPFPPRDTGPLGDLVSSIRLQGVLVPLLVRPRDGAYQVVCGYRRMLAARAAGLGEIPALVVELGDAAAIRCYLAEKVLRRTLAPEEEQAFLESLRLLRDGIQDSRAPEGNPISRDSSASQDSSAMANSRLGGHLHPSALATTFLADRRRSVDLKSEYVGSGVMALYEEAAEIFRTVKARRVVPASRVESFVGDLLAAEESQGAGAFASEALRCGGDPIARHSTLVAALSADLAGVLGWEESIRRDFALAGFLHDVGMLFALGATAQEPRTLTKVERSRMESHTRIGCALISGTGAWPQMVAEAARDHHERWDGSGYPLGAKGTRVPFPSRLMGLLDTFGALISPRTYRDALDPERATEELVKAIELGLYDPAFHFLLKEGLLAPRRAEATPPRTRIAIREGRADLEAYEPALGPLETTSTSEANRAI